MQLWEWVQILRNCVACLPGDVINLFDNIIFRTILRLCKEDFFDSNGKVLSKIPSEVKEHKGVDYMEGDEN